MSDVFSITIPVPKGSYPSLNHFGVDGFRGGGKTKQYKELGQSVLDAAKTEMERTGWKTATYYVSGTITRYQRNANIADPSNIGKCELDFLEKAGVVENDTLIRPIVKDIQYDPGGVDRVVIVLQRIYPRVADVRMQVAKTVRVPKAKAVKPIPVAPLPAVAKASIDRKGMIGNKVVSSEEAWAAAGLGKQYSDKRRRA